MSLSSIGDSIVAIAAAGTAASSPITVASSTASASAAPTGSALPKPFAAAARPWVSDSPRTITPGLTPTCSALPSIAFAAS